MFVSLLLPILSSLLVGYKDTLLSMTDCSCWHCCWSSTKCNSTQSLQPPYGICVIVVDKNTPSANCASYFKIIYYITKFLRICYSKIAKPYRLSNNYSRQTIIGTKVAWLCIQPSHFIILSEMLKKNIPMLLKFT